MSDNCDIGIGIDTTIRWWCVVLHVGNGPAAADNISVHDCMTKQYAINIWICM